MQITGLCSEVCRLTAAASRWAARPRLRVHVNRAMRFGYLSDQGSRRDFADETLAAAFPTAEPLARLYGAQACAWLVVAIRRQARNRTRAAMTAKPSPHVAVELADGTSAHEAFDIGLDLVQVMDLGFHRFHFPPLTGNCY